jgi:hypothetical protein
VILALSLLVKYLIAIRILTYPSIQSKFGNPRRVVEVSYNLISALKKYSFDCDCCVFLAVLNGEVSEDIWLDQQALLQDILVSAPHI